MAEVRGVLMLCPLTNNNTDLFCNSGAKHLFDCPKQLMVPMYLLVGGVACLCLQIFPFFYCSQSDGIAVLPCRILNFLLLLFCPIWFIIGSVFVYTAYQPDYESRHSAEYCERIIYQVAFWITNAIYVSTAFALLCYCCKTCCESRAQNPNSVTVC
ncbi:transmembrane protein 272-like [Astyanax mexicanus]|uniref:transmembrane protein 272-like n=1 Tax=Astyanax mexicanus TaxID=7994 RepID=UPI0020CB0F5E|nr:transmembrane protein 272-like [Astyanax mexicanus]